MRLCAGASGKYLRGGSGGLGASCSDSSATPSFPSQPEGKMMDGASAA